MPTTPKYLLPYPLETDPPDVPLDMQKLANQLDTQLDLWVPKSAVAVPTGVASLDATGKVPAAQLPPVAPPTPPPALVVALPAGPADDQEVVLVDSLANPSYAWHMRYKAAPIGKWVFVGGSPATVFAQAVGNPAAGGAYGAMAGAPTLVIPRAGVYNLALSGDLNVARANAIEISLSGAGLVAGTLYAIRNDQRNAADNPSGNAVINVTLSLAKRMRAIALAAGNLTVLGAFTQPNAVGSVGVGYVEIEAQPVTL